ncbi:MAG: hypothetical protein JWO84_106 [Parcubacteria group bacterium]|nr:hypothetical protein [Parcubacteria group bacterium]
MKFSFDAPKYRKNLAHELQEKRTIDKEGAIKLLKEEQKKLEYIVSEDIKTVQVKLEKRIDAGRDNSKELIQEEEKSQPELISAETLKMEGSDGAQYELEVQTLDISDRIPDSLKLKFDISRLMALDKELSDLGIGPNIANRPKKELVPELGTFDHSINKYLYEKGIVKTASFPLDDYLASLGVNPQEIDDMGREYFKLRHDEMNKLVEGAYSDEHTFVHVLSPYNSEKDERESRSKFTPLERETLLNRMPHSSQENVADEEVFDVHHAYSDKLWFGVGESYGAKPDKITMLCDSRKERFKNEIKQIQLGGTFLTTEDIDKVLNEVRANPDKETLEDRIQVALKVGSRNGEHGIRIEFKKEEPWLLLADWIIDMYHGRLYKITQKNPQITCS